MATTISENVTTEPQIWVHDQIESDLKANISAADAQNQNNGEVSGEHADDNSFCSDASEIANLADVSISDGISSRYAECKDDLAETRMQEEINYIIEVAKLTTATSVDLSKKKMQTLPDELLNLSHLEYIYLEGNQILSLPDDFFKKFPYLRWLDLRNNLLSRIPCAYLSSHTCLRNILLEGNNLRNLPLELGLVKSLHGLNIAGNPLDFPPQEIIERGTKNILSFLRNLYERKSLQVEDLGLNLSKQVPDECEHESASSNDWNTSASMMALAKKREMDVNNKIELRENSQDNPRTDKLQKLYRAFSSTKALPQNYENMKRIAESEIIDRKTKKESKLTWKLNPYPPLPSQDYVTFKMKEQKHLETVKELKQKIDALIQKQKDESMIKKWRDVAKLLQQKKYSQQLQPGKDYEEPGELAPFAIEPEMRKCLSKEDRLKADIQREKQLKEQRHISTATKMRRDQEKQRKIFDLEQRITHHTSAMIERRKRPKGNPQQELDIARRELHLAEHLHSELMAQRRDL